MVAQPGDPHAEAVEGYLANGRSAFARTSLNAWSGQTFEWSSDGTLTLRTQGDAIWSIGLNTTVWWRRPGWFENPALGVHELELAQDEAAVMLPGSLDAAGVRWVDQPWTAARAR